MVWHVLALKKLTISVPFGQSCAPLTTESVVHPLLTVYQQTPLFLRFANTAILFLMQRGSPFSLFFNIKCLHSWTMNSYGRLPWGKSN
jgi:hypothetical protein